MSEVDLNRHGWYLPGPDGEMVFHPYADPIELDRITWRRTTVADIELLNPEMARCLQAAANRTATADELACCVALGTTLTKEDLSRFTMHTVLLDGEPVGINGWTNERGMLGQRIVKGNPPLDPATEPARVAIYFLLPHLAVTEVGFMMVASASNSAAEAGFRSVDLVVQRHASAYHSAMGFFESDFVAKHLPGVGFELYSRMHRAVG